MACLRRSPGLPSPFNSRREYICQLDQCHIPYLIIHTLFSQQQRWIGVNHRRLRLQIHDGSVHDRKASYLCLTNCSEHIMVSSLTESKHASGFRYLYADLYAGAMWAGTESPEDSGNYTSTMIPFSCSKQSPIPCESVAGSPLPALGYIYSFAEDNSKDVFLLTSKGVYRVVQPSLCKYSCPEERITTNSPPPPGPSSSARQLAYLKSNLIISLLLVFISLLVINFSF